MCHVCGVVWCQVPLLAYVMMDINLFHAHAADYQLTVIDSYILK